MSLMWPGSLPQYPRRPDYGDTSVDPTTAFQPEKGPPIERADTTVPMSELKLSFIMTLDQVATFKDFVRRVLSHGTRPFAFPHPDTRNQVEASLTGDRKFEITYYSPLERLVSVRMIVKGEDA